jgi:FtsP/CotA-like multicopper oxidase with cupredoxin domain
VVKEFAGQQASAVPGATNDPGEGALTFYYTNQQSGRLMFYHDHAYGITRLGVYAGEAAGYLLVNPPDEDRLAAATVPGTIGTSPDLAHVIPLVVQDKTFVPPPAQLAAQDPTWDVQRWGGEDALWYPHVYTPNQWPDNPDLSNTNPFGRWDYGPWFWPIQSSLTSVTWDGNPVSRPLTVPCTSAAAVTVDNPNGDTVCPSTPAVSSVPESFLDTPVVNGTAYPTLTVDPAAYRFQVLNAANERNFNLSLFVADASGTEVAMVPAVPHSSSTSPALCSGTAALSAVTGLPNGPDLTTPTCWPREWPVDGRQGGVPDPASAGPKWIQLGTESGLLPSPAVIPPLPIGYEMNKRNIVVLNVALKSLFMGPAERADVVVDFSAYAGKTLILYNDAPAPVPAGDPRQDMYTGAPDMTTVGGSPTPLPGYGPNNRTVMQIRVRAAPQAPQPPLDLAAVTAAVQQSFKASQPKPIVPEAAYNALYNPPVPFKNTYLPIQAMSLTFTPVGEAAPVTIPFGNKALHELFTADYGRMNSLLGVEIPNTNWLNQTTIPFANYDPTTEYLVDGQPQIWKVTHNGVDTHTIHFHLFSAQIVNRVGWDGQIRAPDANELGWKESVRMNPLEDIILALKPARQALPWALPDKIRPLDVDRPLGTASQFTGVDVNNNPIAITNQLVNFGQEYVWHCHLLGHEEMDMLRAEVLVVAPEAATDLVAARVDATTAELSWRDNSRSALTFDVQRSATPDFAAATTLSAPASPTQPGLVRFVDAGLQPAGPYYYRVRATKVLTSPALPGESFPASSAYTASAALASPPAIAVSPTALAFGTQRVATDATPQTVTVSTSGTGGYLIVSAALAGAAPADFAQTTTCTGQQRPGDTCTVTVTFTPRALGARAATLVLTTSSPASPTVSVPLSGTGAAPVAALAPASLAFGRQLVNVASAAQSIAVTNTGTLPLDVAGVALGGAHAGDFAAASGCSAPVAPGGSCAVAVTFLPSATGARAATLTVTTSDPARPALTASLAGTGIAPLLTAAPATLALAGYVTSPPTAGTPRAVVVGNAGSAPAQALTYGLAGPNAADFRVTGTTCGATLAAGATCSVTVAFAPSAQGEETATLTLSASDGVNPTAPVTIALQGSNLVPALALAPAALAFADQLVGTTGATQQLTVRNAGGAPVRVTAVNVTGDAAAFAVTTNCVGTLAPGRTCTVNVGFRPSASGPAAATLSLASNDPAPAPNTAALSGTGVAPVASVSPASLLFTAPLNVTSARQTLTVANTGTAPLALTGFTLAGTGAAFFARTTTCPPSLAAGASCTVDVTFTPTVYGGVLTKTATLAVAVAAPATSPTVPLSGTIDVPTFTLTPAALAFPKQPVGTTSPPQTVLLANTGTAPLALRGITLGGAGRGSFAQTNTCGAVVAAGATCSIDVTFRPTAAGARTATVNVRVSAPAVSQSVTLTGTGQ